MAFNPLDTLANALIKVFIERKDFQRWVRVIASMLVSVTVTFGGVWGLSIPAIYASTNSISVALALGFAAAMVSSASILIFAWRHNPDTRKIPIFFPGRIQQELEKELTDGQTIVTVNDPH